MMMDNLNPIFQQIKENHPQVKASKSKKPISNPGINKVRAVRSDKQHNAKFPVEEVLQQQLRSLCKQVAPLYKRIYNKPLTQTKFNTLLLRYVLNNEQIIDWDIEYKNSKQYMHTNLLESEYSLIGGSNGLAIEKGYSERKTVYIMIQAGVRWFERGGSFEELL